MSAAAIAIPRDRVTPRAELIGASQGLRYVCDAARMVARTDASVLIQGETGTGKELVAGAIHEQSLRLRGPFVKLNCAAMPSGLLESELFGHERGAFTGAITRTTGRFELAHQGTLFLDEIGELPLELQPKLLRVLQEQEFERLGSNRTIRVDVRVVAATNQDLAHMVQERRFRADLFYRLSVFPILLPPLRERREDIPILARHFVDVFGQRMNKECSSIAEGVMEALTLHDWPGNVRELQNVMERSMILCPGPDFQLAPGELKKSPSRNSASTARTLAEAERDHILRALNDCKGIVGGRSGAAAQLGLARTSLIHKMRKLGIARAA